MMSARIASLVVVWSLILTALSVGGTLSIRPTEPLANDSFCVILTGGTGDRAQPGDTMIVNAVFAQGGTISHRAAAHSPDGPSLNK